MNSPIDINKDAKLTLDDFFITREVQVDNLTSNDKLTFEDIASMKNPTDYLS